jgi:hypothetical protein
MRRFVVFFALVAAACGGDSVEKPDNLIPRDKMADIMYDLQLLDAIRTQKPDILVQHQLDPARYVYAKYHIDSLQFARSSEYYAHDLDDYKKLCEEVGKRFDTGATPAAPDAPMVQ